MLSKAKQ